MTLLFYLRSPAGNTDTGQAPDGDTGRRKDYRALEKERLKEEKKAKLLAKKLMDEATQAAAIEMGKRRKKKRKGEELLMMLFMHEFDGYDD